MLNIEKYLEDQKKLFAKRKQTEHVEIDSARVIRKNVNKVENEEEIRCISSGSEYYPSDNELEYDDDFPNSSKRSSQKKSIKLKKYVDDGNLLSYKNRFQEWKISYFSDLPNDVNKSDVISVIRENHDFHEIDDEFAVPNFIWKKLYKYQKTGVKWLWELHRIESGGLLGDEMGLGKTIQIIAFLAGISFSGKGIWGGLGPCLIIAPATVLHQWVVHFHEWWPPTRVACLHQSGSFAGTADQLLREIHKYHGILVTTYAGIVKYNSVITNFNWHYVILDEGHKIRNSETQISRVVRKIKTPHKIVITGSPLQNNLQELWSLFDFMSPGLLGTQSAFMEHFAIPITQGGYTNATPYQENLALSLAIALKNTITPYMLRRTKTDVMDFIKLPEKSEQVLFCSLTSEQKELYKGFLNSHVVRSILDKESRIGDPLRARILVALTTLRKICNHPDLFLFDVDDDEPSEDDLKNKLFGFWRRAGKMIVINSLLKIWKKQGHRALIFTQSRTMICILEQFLVENNYKYLKMDGTTNIGSRQPLIKTFNDDNSYLVFLSTTRVGGLGINLTGADRVIIYDPDWNPATDSQAKERAWRIGQLRNVTVYRLLSAGTIEEKIYQRQVFKQLLSNKVLLNPNQKNYLKTSTLQGLFCLEEPDKNGATETTNIFKHTKVDPNKKSDKANEDVLLSGAVSFSKNKMAAMKKLAQELSKKITNDKNNKNEPEDPREKYKRKLKPPPLPPEEPPANLINDQETSLDFASALSELDIINMCSKPQDTNLSSNIIDEPEITNTEEICNEKTKVKNVDNDLVHEFKDNKLLNDKKKRKKIENESSDINNIEYLEYTKSVKNKRRKTKGSKDIQKDQDDYVLQKLFAKSGVQNALQHDKIVGLAEREEKHRLKVETEKHAVFALRALRKSRIKNS